MTSPFVHVAILAAVAFASTGCGSSMSTAATQPSTTIEGSTTLATTVLAPVAIPTAKDLDLDLPGAEGELDLTTCTLRFPIEAGTLRFEKGSSELPTDGPGRDLLNDVLDQFATATRVQVTGHASTEGRADVNDALARARADAVAAAGRERLPRVDFTAQGVGASSTTVVEDGTEATRARNRRVEMSGQIAVEECKEPG